MHPDRVVVGADAAHALGGGRGRGGCTSRSTARSCAPTSPSAEMIKLASNAFLATKISFINEIANVCEEVGADVAEVARRHGPRPAHRRQLPERGRSAIGGSCLPGDETVMVRSEG